VSPGATPPARLLDRTPEEARRLLEGWLAEEGEPRYRGEQILRELYLNRRADPNAMTALPRALRERLGAELLAEPLQQDLVQVSTDGTRKFRFRLADGAAIESVWIPSGERGTLCVSSQVGCAAACSFCATGTLGLSRNLHPSEILGQWLHVDRSVREQELGAVTQIVFMGMGEPLHNWPHLSTTLRTLTAPEGFEFSPRRVTVSTVGIAPKIPALIEEFPQVRLALSLHSAIEETRARIVPVTRRHPLTELREALSSIRGDARRLSIEYVVLPGVNDAPEEAAALARFADEFGAHVNLLPFHPFEGAPHAPSTPEGIARFARAVSARARSPVTVRRSRGLDIDGACGQLALKGDADGESGGGGRAPPPPRSP
jgi:23S rRNA (adenine2503-C2)-methyltransferase